VIERVLAGMCDFAGKPAAETLSTRTSPAGWPR
jgi:hypothetical protein